MPSRTEQHDDLRRVGFVAFLDALGFTGIWQSYKPEDVVKKLRVLTDRFSASTRPAFDPGIGPTQTVAAFADTIVFASTVTVDDDDLNVKAGALEHLTQDLADLWKWMLMDPPDPPLALRGAISWGEHIVSQ